MTSINALRFNEHEGAMTCDEQRGWNDENLRIQVADKIRAVVPDRMVEELGVVAAYGNTGTSSIGDELRLTIKDAIEEEYESMRGKPRKALEAHFTIDRLARIAYETICRMKHRHIDEELRSKWGFTTRDFVRGFYMKDGEKIEIKDKEIREEAYELITWEKKGKGSQSVFLNAGILAGFAPASGFRIFHLDIMQAYYEQVGEIFTAQGSGTMRATPVFAEFAMRIDLRERDRIDRRVGVHGILDAVNEAKRVNVGVGGYPNILLFDGRAENGRRLVQVSDHRSKLASEIVECSRFGYLPYAVSLDLLDRLLYHDEGYVPVHEAFWKAVPDARRTRRFLRGYHEKRNV